MLKFEMEERDTRDIITNNYRDKKKKISLQTIFRN